MTGWLSYAAALHPSTTRRAKARIPMRSAIRRTETFCRYHLIGILCSAFLDVTQEQKRIAGQSHARRTFVTYPLDDANWRQASRKKNSVFDPECVAPNLTLI